MLYTWHILRSLHYLHIDMEMEIASTVVSVTRVRESETGDNLARSLIEVMEEWDVLQKVFQIVTDGAENIRT